MVYLISIVMPGFTATRIYRQRGQSLVEVIIAFAVFAILIGTVFTVVSLSFKLTANNRARITAIHIAQEKIELVRNLPYDDVATIGGIPSGTSIPQSETINENGLNFTVTTNIIYVDDSFDGTEDGSPDDTLPTDYKRVRVEVNWEGITAPKKNPVVFVTDIVPKGVETTVGGGTLSILVYDANLDPVSDADVNIYAPGADPQVDLNVKTGSNGRIILPGAPACISCYEITVSKSGYTEDRTYSTLEVDNPDKPHQSVFEGDLTEIGFAVDKVSSLTINSYDDRDSGFNPLVNVGFHLTGTKKIGTDQYGTPVYKVDEDYSTDGSGSVTINDLEWDTYTFTLLGTTYSISGSNPYLPIIIVPDQNHNYDIALSSYTLNNLLLYFTDSNSSTMASVSATLSDGGGFTKNLFSGSDGDPDYGQVFFDGLNSVSYNLEATASGFQNINENVNISGQTSQSFTMLPN